MAGEVYLERLQVVDSTNRYIRDNAVRLWHQAKGCKAVCVTAESQTAGRGQRGNVWHSQQGVNLLFSIMVRPLFLSASRQFLLSEAVALAIRRVLLSYGINAMLKWPNDIYIDCRKISGVLIEIDYSGCSVEQAIIGIGINVNQTEFPSMDKNPVSMKTLLGHSVDRDELLLRIFDAFMHYYDILRCDDASYLHSEYRQYLLGLGEERSYIDEAGAFKAVIEDVEPTGHLLLRRDDGSLARYAFKEVQQFV